jgi:hypothetical protein
MLMAIDTTGGHRPVSSDTGSIWPGDPLAVPKTLIDLCRHSFHAVNPFVPEPHCSLWLTNFMIIFDLKGNERYRNAKEGVQKPLMTLRNTRLTATR